MKERIVGLLPIIVFFVLLVCCRDEMTILLIEVLLLTSIIELWCGVFRYATIGTIGTGIVSYCEPDQLSQNQRFAYLRPSTASADWYRLEFVILVFAMLSIVISCLDFSLALAKREFLFAIITLAGADVGGFFVGKLGGRHHPKSLRQISPKKTFEGYLGMLLTGWLVGFLAIHWGIVGSQPANWLFVAFSGMIAAAGDFVGSAAKRALGMKDSREALMVLLEENSRFQWPLPIVEGGLLYTIEKLLGGHGGFLDRLDSLSCGLIVMAVLTTLPALW